MAIYKQTKNGPQRLSNKAVKEEIKQIRGWSETRYQKELKQVKKGLQRYTGNQKKTPQEFLYTESKARKHYGESYTPSAYVQDIRRLAKLRKPTTRAGKRSILSIKGQIRIRTLRTTAERFKGLIRENEKAKEIFNKIKDPFKQQKALTDYANKLHAEIDRQGRVIQNRAIPISEQSYGSDTSIDFDINNYL